MNKQENSTHEQNTPKTLMPHIANKNTITKRTTNKRKPKRTQKRKQNTHSIIKKTWTQQTKNICLNTKND